MLVKHSSDSESACYIQWPRKCHLNTRCLEAPTCFPNAARCTGLAAHGPPEQEEEEGVLGVFSVRTPRLLGLWQRKTGARQEVRKLNAEDSLPSKPLASWRETPRGRVFSE